MRVSGHPWADYAFMSSGLYEQWKRDCFAARQALLHYATMPSTTSLCCSAKHRKTMLLRQTLLHYAAGRTLLHHAALHGRAAAPES